MYRFTSEFLVNREVRSFKYMLGHHVDFQAVIEERGKIEFLINRNFRKSGRACIKLLEVTEIDVSVKD